jgi:hypothetical protein
MTMKGFRDSFREYTPSWLQNRPALNVAYRFLWSMIVPLDLMMQAIFEGLKAAWPGVGTPTAFPYIGRSRGILRGEAESDTSYATRLIAWLDTWKDAGSDAVLAGQIQSYLGNTPMVRIVDRAGHWTTIASDGTVTTNDAAWDWDSHSNPERAGYWSELWIIVYPTEWAITGTTLASLVGLWGTGTGLGTGHAVPRAAVDAILSLVATWKGAHTYVRAIIWSYDGTLFDPTNPGSLPDGYWGNWSKNVSGNRRPSRSSSARYWVPRTG